MAVFRGYRETLQTDKELREIFFIDSVGYCVGFSGTFMKYHYSQPTSNIQIISPNGGEHLGNWFNKTNYLE